MTGYSVGDTASYTCNDDFELNGVGVLTCQANGTWDNPPPSCHSLAGMIVNTNFFSFTFSYTVMSFIVVNICARVNDLEDLLSCIVLIQW